ncbi:MAG: ComF family protein [Herminiimonas sp.]|nr:ComF family protein [Herminiimonas sp.]
MLSRLRHWFAYCKAGLPDLPSSCSLCGRAGAGIVCNGCRAQFFQSGQPRCLRCAIPLPKAGSFQATSCGGCLKQTPAFDATIVATDYAPPADRLVLALKFGSQLALAPCFARMLRDALLHAQRSELPTLLVPVPLGKLRLAERGFNQALEIARPLSKALGIRLDPYLAVRTRDTPAQSLLHPDQRHKNMRNAFIVSSHAIGAVRGRHIGVVDDVMTTGETLNEMATMLKRFGAARVTNFVFARTLLK